LRTHLARFVVLDQPFYNGRDPADSLVSAIRNTDLLAAQPNDELSCPYLLVMIDFDPQGDGTGEPRSYFEELWGLMPRELTAVFNYCYGFSKVTDAASFADFILPCQLETTMPFNDYWVGAPPLTSLSKNVLIAIPAVGLALPLLAGLFGYLHFGAAILIALVFAAIGLLIDYKWVMANGSKPFPAAPNSSLRDVLKALYLQQAFTRFAAEQQGRTGENVGIAFRAFLQQHRPNDLAGPTQPPGVIRSTFGGNAA
jgi:hypothetical protein